ncbi:MAG: hypothetical protein K1X55_07265 [Chitinophagales bacterium]|nr:hypothetical protein [Chitinophagales bacterium]
MQHSLGYQMGLLREFLSDIPLVDYSKPIPIFSGATIGQHTRHMIDGLQILVEGYPSGEISYENRKRDVQTETDVNKAISLIDKLLEALPQENKAVLLYANYQTNSEDAICINSSYDRELVHQLEHFIHHMAIIKIGYLYLHPQYIFHEEFGIAPSTLRYKYAG